MRFAYDGDARVHVENVPPFALFGDTSGDYDHGAFSPGKHTLAATPFTENSANGDAGVSLAIAFVVAQGESDHEGFENGSGLGHIGPNREALINGFVVAGDQPKPIVLRALGRSLQRFGIKTGLADPSLELRDSRGALLASNNNWRDSQQQLFDADGPYSAFRPFDESESAIAIQLAPGSYTAIVRSHDGSYGKVLSEVYDVSGSRRSKLTNVSVRAFVEVNDVLIGGFIVRGATPTRVILRALGPSLFPYGIIDVLDDPSLAVFDQEGNLVSYSDEWQTDANQAAEIVQRGLAPHSPKDAACALTLAPGRYTVVVRGQNHSAGTALFDIYQVP